MTARSIRRALERKQKKLAQKSEQQAARLAANRENASDEAAILSEPKIQKRSSTGPTSPEGKAKSSLNAIKTGLTGRTVLLSTDDAAQYENHLAAFEDEYRPAGIRERELVQSIADTYWRLARIPALEAAIFAKGRIEFAGLFEDAQLIDAHTFLVYEKQIRNLHLQESRLVRRREKETKELRELQDERKQRESEIASPAAPLKLIPNGFVFSNPEINAFSTQKLSDNPPPMGMHAMLEHI